MKRTLLTLSWPAIGVPTVTNLLKVVETYVLRVGATFPSISKGSPFCCCFYKLSCCFYRPTSQYLTFSNVTLVSEHGLPTVAECLKAADTCVPKDGRYTDRYLKTVPFYFYIDVMPAIMTGIDRLVIRSYFLLNVSGKNDILSGHVF